MLCLLLLRCGPVPAGNVIVLATTTSVGNSGLLDVLLRAFRQDRGVEVRAHLIGSGLALQMLARDDVDVVISHAPEAEASALQQHPRWRYRKIMFNDFVVVGPPDDPARVKGSPNAAAAMRRIATSASTFLSRGDESGTHEREQQLWRLAGTKPASGRLVIAGTGMGTTLRVAGEMGAYTLTDRATFAQHASALPLVVVFEGDPRLLNTYAVIVNLDGSRAAGAVVFSDWLADGRGRSAIATWQTGPRGPAFRVWPAGRARDRPDNLPNE